MVSGPLGQNAAIAAAVSKYGQRSKLPLRHATRTRNIVLMIEQWLPVDGFPYEVSSEGRVRRGSRLLKPLSRLGYLRVCLCLNNKRNFKLVHVLVAEAFIGPRPPGHDVAHLDGDRQNNRAGNLAYKTRAENEADKRTHGTVYKGERNHKSRLTIEAAAEIKSRLATGAMHTELAAEYGVSTNTIWCIKHGRTWRDA